MRTPGTVRTAQAMRASLHAVNPASPSPKRKTQKPHGWATFIKQPASQRANLGDVLCHSPRKLQTILFNGSARTALKMVGSDQ